MIAERLKATGEAQAPTSLAPPQATPSRAGLRVKGSRGGEAPVLSSEDSETAPFRRNKAPIQQEETLDELEPEALAPDEDDLEEETEDHEIQPDQEDADDSDEEYSAEGETELPDEDEDPAPTSKKEPDDSLKVSFETETGETRTVKLSELKELAKQGVNYASKQELLDIETTKLHKQLTDHRQKAQYETYQAAQALHFYEEQLNAQMRNIETYKMTDFNAYESAKQSIQEQYNGLMNQRQALQRQWEQGQQDALNQLRLIHREALLRKRPDLDQATHGKMIDDVLLKAGYESGELSNLVDHRLILLALQNAELTKKVSDFEKGRQLTEARLRKKTQKPQKTVASKKRGAPKAKPKQERFRALEAKLKKSGDIKDAKALFSARLRG